MCNSTTHYELVFARPLRKGKSVYHVTIKSPDEKRNSPTIVKIKMAESGAHLAGLRI